MKRYYYKKDETELARLKSDLSYYAKVMGFDFVSDENSDGWACEIRKDKEARKAVVVVIRNSSSRSVTIEMGVINWIDKAVLLNSFFPELLSHVEEVPVTLFENKEKDIRHDVKVLTKVRLGSYFNTRQEAE